MPEVVIYTSSGTRTCIISGRKYLLATTIRRGTIPSFTICCPWYTSYTNRFKAVIRCRRPFSRTSHSSLGITRGIRSKGMVRSRGWIWEGEYKVKVMPSSIIRRLKAACLAPASPAFRDANCSNTWL
ncbi:hypothetical protein D3C75_1025710 [compost metagenome]